MKIIWWNNYNVIYKKSKINKENLKESLKYLDVPVRNIIRDREIIYKKMKVNKIKLSL